VIDMPPVSISPAVDAVREAVSRAGGGTYLVGGSLRDRLIGRPQHDHDLMVVRIALARLPGLLGGQVVGESFAVLNLRLLGEKLDVAVPRRERSTGPKHRDFAVEGDPDLPVDQDLARRDFTMNAMALCLDDGTTVDPFGGADDVAAETIRAVGDASARFTEDPLRMLRAARFVAQLGFSPEPATRDAMASCAALVSTVARERIVEETTKLLGGPSAPAVGAALRLLRDAGLLQIVCPPFAASVGFEQKNPHHHLAVDEHVFAAVEHAVARGASARARLAVLLHDVGKPASFTVGEDGAGHFFGHEDLGADMVRGWMAPTSMPFPTDLAAAVELIVREHLRPPSDASDKVLRRWLALMGDAWEDALACREADLSAHSSKVAKGAVEWADGIRARVAALGTDIRGFDESRLALRGGEIAARFGAKGPEIGRLKRLAAQAVIDGEVPNEAEAIAAWLGRQTAAATSP
jgi:tRNA nucleotidyltransferase/poly(A) polymerase